MTREKEFKNRFIHRLKYLYAALYDVWKAGRDLQNYEHGHNVPELITIANMMPVVKGIYARK